MNITLFDSALHRQRIIRFLNNKPLHPVYKMIDECLQERFFDITHPLPSVLTFGAPWYTHFSPPKSVNLSYFDDPLPEAPPFDALYMPMQMHGCHDLLNFFKTCIHALKEDGVFLGTCLIQGSLEELAAALLRTDIQHSSGASPRVSPLRTLHDIGHALQSSGFQLITMDQDTFTLNYASFEALLWDLRSAAGANILVDRTRYPVTRRFWKTVQEIYNQQCGRQPSDPWPMTLRVAFITAWKPGPHQPQPLKPGSAQLTLTEWLGSRNR